MKIGQRVLDIRPGGWGHGTIIPAIGGVPGGEDHTGTWCEAVEFDTGGRHFVAADYLTEVGDDAAQGRG